MQRQFSYQCEMFANDSEQLSIPTIDTNWTWPQSPSVIFIGFSPLSIHKVLLVSASPIGEQHPDKLACSDRWSTLLSSHGYDHWLFWRSKDNIFVDFLNIPRDGSLTSLTLDSRWCNTREQQQIAEHLSSILGQPTFVRLRLLSEGLCELIDQLEWPAECKLQYLTMEFFTEKQVNEILLRASDLRRLVLGTRVGFMSHNPNTAAEISFTLHPQLTSLSISSRCQSIDTIFSLFSCTPCLRHLRIVNTHESFLNASRWEDLIKTKLPVLHDFEFYFRFSLIWNRQTMPVRLNHLMSPFHTPFWTNEKRWPITFNFFPSLNLGEIYTSPICTSSYTYFRDQSAMSFSTFAVKDRLPSKCDEVNQLRVDLSKVTDPDERVSQLNHWTVVLWAFILDEIKKWSNTSCICSSMTWKLRFSSGWADEQSLVL